jgi:predicted outer membrane repeat protein
MVFLIIITTSAMISANDLDSINETTTSNDPEVTSENLQVNDIYVNNNIEKSGNGTESHPFKTIKEAINYGNAQENPVTINIHSGTYNEKEMKITNNMIIKSYNGEVTLDANNRGWFLYSSNPDNNLSLMGLIFKNGIRYDSDNSADGGVVKTEGHLDVVNCTFENNFGGTGGGINSHKGANIINSTFRNNKAEYNGAGVYVLDGQTNIINCIFENNYAKRQGGAIRIQGSTYIENSTFTNNKASLTEGNGYTGFAGNGGAVRVTDGDLNVESSTFINNSAHFAGGAISAGDDSQYSTTHYQLNINNSTFDGNSAVFGAGIEANDGINLTNSILTNNSVPNTVSAKHGLGSGVYVLNGDSILSGNTIKDNTNSYNSFCPTIYSNNGNVAEKDNDWGSSDRSIKTENGQTTSNINGKPSVKKPAITIYNGNQKITNHQNEQQNIPETTNSPEQNRNTQEKQSQNSIKTEKKNQVADSKKTIFDTSSNTKNDMENYNSNNMIKTNSSNSNDVKSNSENNADIGESSETIQGSEEPSSASTIHEISAIKSLTSNDNVIPYIILAIVMFLAFIIGYRKKQNEY